MAWSFANADWRESRLRTLTVALLSVRRSVMSTADFPARGVALLLRGLGNGEFATRFRVRFGVSGRMIVGCVGVSDCRETGVKEIHTPRLDKMLAS